MAGTSKGTKFDGDPGQSPNKSRFCWFLYITKVEDTYSLHIGSKNTKGTKGEISCSKLNATNKVPFDAPIECEYIITMKAEESIGMMQFTSRRREVKQLRMSQLNCFEGGDNDFSRKVASMVVDRKEKLLGEFLGLLSYSKGFSLHREETHSDEGELLDDIIDDTDGTLSDEDVKNEYAEFRRVAMESAKVVSIKRTGIRHFFSK